MKRRILFIAVPVIVLGILLWQLPAILRAIPSRYVAAYAPEPLQTLAVRDHAEVLPTAAVSVDPDTLLQKEDELAAPAATLPPPLLEETATPETADGSTTAVDPAATAPPTATSTPAPTPTPSPTPRSIPPAARLENFRHQFQDWNNCGPATLAMSLSYFGLNTNQNETAATLKPNPEDRNVSPYEMATYVNEQTEFQALDRVNGDLDVVRDLLAAGFPVIIELGIEPPGEYRWLGWYGHYLLLVAYEDAARTFWTYDSWFGTSEVPEENAHADGRLLSYADMDRGWEQFNRSYIVLYRPEQEAEVAAIIGAAIDDTTMWQEALARNQAAAAEEPENGFLWFNLGVTYNALSQFDKAAAAFDQARAMELPWRMLWYQFGPYEAYYQIGRYDEVILLADITLQDRPYFEESFYYKGLALAALGDENAARENFEKAVDFNPNFTPAVEALARLSG